MGERGLQPLAVPHTPSPFPNPPMGRGLHPSSSLPRVKGGVGRCRFGGKTNKESLNGKHD